MFVKPTPQEIYDRIVADIESRLKGNAGILRVALLRVLAGVFTGAIVILYTLLEVLMGNVMPDKCDEEWLGRHGFVWGVPRKGAQYATGFVTATGIDGTIIPKGTILVKGTTGIEYEVTTDTGILYGTAIVPVKAKETGESSNIPYDVVTTLSFATPLAPVSETLIIIDPGIGGGYEQEGVEAWRSRIIQRIQNPPLGGNAADYFRWANEVSGVEKAWVFPTLYGAGTVIVVTKPADGVLAQTVQTHIDTVKPLTANDQIDQYVFPIVNTAIDMTIAISPYNLSTEDAVRSGIVQFFSDEGIPGGKVLISHLNATIVSTGIYDYTLTSMIYKGTLVPVDSDLQMNGFDYPSLGSITFTQKV